MKHFNTFLWIQPNSLMAEMQRISYYVFPRTQWTLLCGFFGFDKVNHIDFDRINVVGAHEAGGASSLDIYHYAKLMRIGRFVDRDGHDYYLSSLKQRLNDSSIMLF